MRIPAIGPAQSGRWRPGTGWAQPAVKTLGPSAQVVPQLILNDPRAGSASGSRGGDEGWPGRSADRCSIVSSAEGVPSA